jgi:hypothetical protein
VIRVKHAIIFTSLATLIATAFTPAEAGGYRRKPRTSTTNTAPVISGTPSTSVQAATLYAFTPSASDAQSSRLTFYVSNRPAWATFSSSTGKLTGTPASAQAGTYSNIVIRVSDGALTSYLPAFGITVTGTPAVNAPPVITGTPPLSVAAGGTYAFTPSARDADSSTLGFSVSNKPAWAAFSTATGSLTGTPTATQAGSYANIVLSVSDGVSVATLPAFGISVDSAATAAGSATLTWSAPTQNTDGSSLTDLAGYKVYHGTSPAALNSVVLVAGSGANSYTYSQLAQGTHYFAVAAYTTGGVESALSALGSKTIQ